MRGIKFRVSICVNPYDITDMPLAPLDTQENSAITALRDTYRAVNCRSFEEYQQLSEQEVKNRLRKLLNETE